jgi:hypothetical protein
MDELDNKQDKINRLRDQLCEERAKSKQNNQPKDESLSWGHEDDLGEDDIDMDYVFSLVCDMGDELARMKKDIKALKVVSGVKRIVE